MDKNITLEGLTKDEQKLLKDFVKNEPLFEAVQKVMRIGISRETGKEFTFATDNWIFGVDDTMPDDQYGSHVKMLAKAYSLVGSAFVRIKALGSIDNKPADPGEEAR